MTEAQITVKGRDKKDRPGMRLQWQQLTGANKTRLALGVAPLVECLWDDAIDFSEPDSEEEQDEEEDDEEQD